MIRDILRILWRAFVKWLRAEPVAKTPTPSPSPKIPRYRLVRCSDRTEARKAIADPRVVALIGAPGAYKWAQMRCPCGCGADLALSLMKSHTPRWSITIRDNNSFALHPSVHSTTCGAHFWLRNGELTWCE